MISIFIGTRIEAFKILEKYSLVQHIITKKNSYVDKYIDKTKHNIKYVNLKNKNKIFKFIKDSNVDLILSSGFPYIIPGKYLKKKIKIINSHPSLLPKYKGLSPIKEALMNNEPEIGVTVHYMNDKVDDGKIIAVKKLNIKRFKNIDTIYKKIFSITEPQAIKKALESI
jgi:phosphoribosylglycinamide formyltransferase-1